MVSNGKSVSLGYHDSTHLIDVLEFRKNQDSLPTSSVASNLSNKIGCLWAVDSEVTKSHPKGDDDIEFTID